MQEFRRQQQESRTPRGPPRSWNWSERSSRGPAPKQHPSLPPTEMVEPMQLGRARLTPEERRRRQAQGCCFYCGEKTHLVATCPVKRPKAVSPDSRFTHTPRALTPVNILHHGVSTTVRALIDSGADRCMMDWGLAEQLGLQSEPLTIPIEAKALNGYELFTIWHQTELVKLCIDNHEEHVHFLLFKSSSRTLVLGYSWLRNHNPSIDWKTGGVSSWGKDCTIKGKCRVNQDSVNHINHLSLNVITESVTDLRSVPTCYHHLREVFSKS